MVKWPVILLTCWVLFWCSFFDQCNYCSIRNRVSDINNHWPSWIVYSWGACGFLLLIGSFSVRRERSLLAMWFTVVDLICRISCFLLMLMSTLTKITQVSYAKPPPGSLKQFFCAKHPACLDPGASGASQNRSVDDVKSQNLDKLGVKKYHRALDHCYPSLNQNYFISCKIPHLKNKFQGWVVAADLAKCGGSVRASRWVGNCMGWQL